MNNTHILTQLRYKAFQYNFFDAGQCDSWENPGVNLPRAQLIDYNRVIVTTIKIQINE